MQTPQDVQAGLSDLVTERVLCIVRGLLSEENQRRLLDGVPADLRDEIAACEPLPLGPEEQKGAERFFIRAGDQLGRTRDDARALTRSVLRLVRRSVSGKDAEEIGRELPGELAEMWRSAALEEALARRDQRVFEAFVDQLRKSGFVADDRVEVAADAVLCTLARHLTPVESEHLAMDLPSPLSEIVRRCAAHPGLSKAPLGERELEQEVADYLDVSLIEAQEITRAVLDALYHQLSREEVDHIARLLSPAARDLWMSLEPKALH